MLFETLKADNSLGIRKDYKYVLFTASTGDVNLPLPVTFTSPKFMGHSFTVKNWICESKFIPAVHFREHIYIVMFDTFTEFGMESLIGHVVDAP
jgi:hypothetical protein